MKTLINPQADLLGLLVLGFLAAASVVVAVLNLTVKGVAGRKTVEYLVARTKAWWVMCVLVFVAVLLGTNALIVFFGIVSFLALREFVTLTNTRKSDHRSLFYAFFLITPIQYALVYAGWYGFFAIFIPVFAGLVIAVLGTLKGDSVNYLARTAKIHWGLLICVYAISHIPALLELKVTGMQGKTVNLLLFLLVVVECGDVFGYVWGKLLGKAKVSPNISPNKTWVGLVMGTLTATGIGAGLWWLTPFLPWQAAVVSLVILLVGFGGGIVMAAVKRDAGIKDFGDLIQGHGGVLDRMDSLAFAAPVFFHVVRFWFCENPGVAAGF
jgi:phosphatidate cytidylyltransferase